jgi:sulfonate transport system permease protein
MSRNKLKNALIGLLVPLILLIAWVLVTRYELFSAQLLPPPKMLFETWLDMQRSGELADNMKVSLVRVVLGFLLGAVTGFLLGTAMGVWRSVDQYLSPLFNCLRQIPIVGWLPFFILLLGIDELFKIAFIAMGTLIPVAVKTLEGVKGVPVSYLEVVKVFEFGWFRILRTVIIPSALPSIITGLRLGLSEAWMLVVGAELVAASAGIGNVMTIARRLFQTDVVLVGVIVIAITGYIMDRMLGLLESRYIGWRRVENPR